MTSIYEIFSTTAIQNSSSPIASTVERKTYWPGGQGKLIISGIMVTGTASIIDFGFTVTGPYGLPSLITGVPSYNSDVVYDFSLPEGVSVMLINVPSGDSLTLGSMILLKV